MQDYRKRRSSKQDVMRAVLGALGVLLLALVAFFAVKAAWGMYGKFAAASEADAAAHADLDGLKKQYTQVGAAAEALSSDRGMEAGVRERYGVAKPGEGQIDIIRREATTSAAAADEPNIFVKIFRALFVW
ncbi:MAG TPA: hypothetical protein VGP13_02385 [Candidatus Paceibacterota bacterium]|jgi:cell division protein FtsB|nr:hypothetical protein [Candidatus Paceibacterota bacterium]